MNNISFGNLTYQNTQKKLQNPASQQEFGSLDKAKLQQDAVELSSKAKEEVKENFVYRTLRNTFHVEDPKKFLISLGLTLGTVVGGAYVGNRLSNSTATLGNKVDKFLENNKAYNAVGDALNGAKKKVGNKLSQSKTIQDITETFELRKAKVRCDITRGYGRGFVSIFSLTPVDIFEKAFKQAGIDDVQSATKAMKKLVGDAEAEKFAKQILNLDGVEKAADSLKKYSNNLDDLLQQAATSQKLQKALTTQDLAKELAGMSNPKKVAKVLKKALGDNADIDKINQIAKEIVENRTVKDNRAFCESVSMAMRKHLGCAGNGADDYAKFTDYLIEMQKGTLNGVDVSEFVNVNMTDKSMNGIISSWWPVNIINSIGKKFNPNFNFCRGNLGDSLVKFNAVNGTLAKTKAGSLVQKSITVPTESITNFVNDKSGLGFFLGQSIFGLYNNVQDAPKDKKAATVADDYIGTIGSIAIATPLAFASTYGLASLKNLKGDTIITKGLKQVGKFFGMGLERFAKDGKSLGATSNPVIKLAGGALRFVLVMFVFSPKFQQPIRNAIHKIFGKPYDKAAEEQQQKLEQEKNTIIPELGITQGEFVEKINSNPAAIEKIQQDPELAAELQKNPKKLLDLLDGKEVSKVPATEESTNGLSPLNSKVVAQQPQQPQQAQQAQQAPSAQPQAQAQTVTDTQIDTATYVPSSKFVAKNSISPEQSQEIDKAMAKADKILAKAQQYI